MVLSLDYKEKVAHFFGREPIGHEYSTLALIRNDIDTIVNGGPNYLAFPQAMCLMVAIDLLGKIQTGSDQNGGSGDRFKRFVKFALDPAIYGHDIGTKVYEFRNALHHSYRMHTKWVPDGLGGHKASWQFALIDNPTVPKLTWEEQTCTVINLCRLRAEIDGGIKRFHELLENTNDSATRDNFEKMFAKHGWMVIG